MKLSEGLTKVHFAGLMLFFYIASLNRPGFAGDRIL